MEYMQALEYLQNMTKFGINLGLGRITNLLERLGNPQDRIPVIHVGGTNGKGSTSAMLSAVLQQLGNRVGTFTSPHLHRYTERYRINGQEIEPEGIADLIGVVAPHIEAMVAEGHEHPTEFEVSTAMGFVYFAREQVDFLVLEVGLGGAIDSTNVVKPVATVITNVAMDHMDYLGNSEEEIASVKSGIIKEGVPIVTATAHPGALQVIRETADKMHAPLTTVSQSEGADVTWEITTLTPKGLLMDWQGRTRKFEGLQVNLLGRHQAANASTALAVLEQLEQLGRIKLPEEGVRQGLAQVKWPARLEVVQQSPMVVIDGAHNLDGAKTLHQALQEAFTFENLIMVIGMLADKERAKVVAELAPLAKCVIITKPNNPRAGDWQNLSTEVAKYVADVRLEENIGVAVDQAIAMAGPQDLVCITGSLYMVSEAREKWFKTAEL